MLEEVDFDVAAAQAAAEACDDGAMALASRAGDLSAAGSGPLASWSGASAIQFDGAAGDLAEALQREAASLRATADRIRQAIADARREDARRIAAREAREAAERREAQAREAEAREAARREAAV